MTKRYKYYQPNKLDLKDTIGDCQIRALCKVLGLEWREAFDLTIPLCRELQTYTLFDCDLEKTHEAMRALGFEYTGISNKRGTKRPTVEQFAREHKTGRYIVKVAHHVVAVVDGQYFDTWDSGNKSLYGYYELVGPSPEIKDEGREYRVRAYFDEATAPRSYGPRAYKRKVVTTRGEAEELLAEAREYYSGYKYIDKVVIERREVSGWATA